MSEIYLEPTKIWEEYQNGLIFNEAIDLPSRVKKAENFFIGRQWEGVNAPDMDKPVFNILKRVVNYFIAMLVSDNIAVSLSLFNRKEDNINKVNLSIIKKQIEQVMEYNRFGQLSRQILRDAAVDGDGVLHVYFDPEVETGWEDVSGFIRAEKIDNQNLFFGNPQNHEVEEQPYLILSSRKYAEDVREEMRKNGQRKNAEFIMSDMPNDLELEQEYGDSKKVTVLTKYYKKDGVVYYIKCTKDTIIKPPTRMGLKRYPICYLSWERVKNCYHGASAIDWLIPNQIAINKMAAMAQQFIKQQAFPRVFYNENKLKKWVSGIKPIGVQGDPSGIVYTDQHDISMSGQVSQYIDKFISNTRDLMGASDAALGNVDPKNTSAIIAVQKSTAVPLELVKQEYYRFVEDFVRILIDEMRTYYGLRPVLAKDESDEWQEVVFDFDTLNRYVLELNIDIGSSAYWSEMTASATLDNLYGAGLINAVTYLESIPKHLVPNHGRIVEEAKEGELAKMAGEEDMIGDAEGSAIYG